MGRLDDIQTPLIPLKIREKLKQMFMTILGLADSFKRMNRPGPIIPRSNSLFLGKYSINDSDVK